MQKKLVSRGRRVIRKVRAAARKAKKEVTRRRTLTAPPAELRHTAENPMLLSLKQEYERLKDEIQHQEVLTQDHPSTGNHMADDASEVFEQTKNLALKSNLEHMLEQAEHAMLRIEKGTYGLCEKCGQLINPDRLSALPSATTCVECARLAPHAV